MLRRLWAGADGSRHGRDTFLPRSYQLATSRLQAAGDGRDVERIWRRGGEDVEPIWSRREPGRAVGAECACEDRMEAGRLQKAQQGRGMLGGAIGHRACSTSPSQSSSVCTMSLRASSQRFVERSTPRWGTPPTTGSTGHQITNFGPRAPRVRAEEGLRTGVPPSLIQSRCRWARAWSPAWWRQPGFAA
jgi:hypothetical protein